MSGAVAGAAWAGAGGAIADIAATNAASEAVDAAETKAKFDKKGRDAAKNLI